MKHKVSEMLTMLDQPALVRYMRGLSAEEQLTMVRQIETGSYAGTRPAAGWNVCRKAEERLSSGCPLFGSVWRFVSQVLLRGRF